MRRTVRNIETKIEFNNPDDFLRFDYKITFHHEENKAKVDAAIKQLYCEVQKILEDDRTMQKSEDDFGR